MRRVGHYRLNIRLLLNTTRPNLLIINQPLYPLGCSHPIPCLSLQRPRPLRETVRRAPFWWWSSSGSSNTRATLLYIGIRQQINMHQLVFQLDHMNFISYFVSSTSQSALMVSFELLWNQVFQITDSNIQIVYAFSKSINPFWFQVLFLILATIAKRWQAYDSRWRELVSPYGVF